MKYRNGASVLIAFALLQAGEAPPKKINQVRVGSLLHTFHIENVEVSSGLKKTQRLFRLKGRLVPVSGTPIHLELAAYQNGQLYMLKMTRPRGAGESEDGFAATLKTKVEVLQFNPTPGGSLHLRLSGPLAATLKDGGIMTTWGGEIRANLAGVAP